MIILCFQLIPALTFFFKTIIFWVFSSSTILIEDIDKETKGHLRVWQLHCRTRPADRRWTPQGSVETAVATDDPFPFFHLIPLFLCSFLHLFNDWCFIIIIRLVTYCNPSVWFIFCSCVTIFIFSCCDTCLAIVIIATIICLVIKVKFSWWAIPFVTFPINS